MITGQSLYQELQSRCFQAYSGFIDVNDGNRYFKWGIIRLFSNRWNKLAGTEYLDEMRNYTVSDLQITPDVNNKVYLDGVTAPFVPAYLHLLNIRLKFYENLFLPVVNATNTNPIVVTVAQQNTYNNQKGNNLRTSNYSAVTPEQLVISGIGGNTAANGTFYIKKKGKYNVALYNDSLFTSPVAGNGAFVPYLSVNATIQRVYDYPAKPYLTVEKGGKIPNPTIRYPNYQVSDGAIKCFPDNQQCQGLTIDYLKNNIVYIDCANNSFDLNTLYTNKFLDDVLSEASLMYSEEVRDSGLEQTSVSDIRNNP